MHLAFTLEGFSVLLTTGFEIGVKISYSVCFYQVTRNVFIPFTDDPALSPLEFNGRNKDFGTQHNGLSLGLPVATV